MSLLSDLLSGGAALDKLWIPSSAAGPASLWLAGGDGVAAFGSTSSVQACVKAGVEASMLERCFRGINLDFRFASPETAL